MKKIICTIAMLSVMISAVSCGGEPELSSSAPPDYSSTSSEVSKSNNEISSSESSASEISESESSANPPTEPKSEFNIGETWVVDGQWELTVTGVSETEERNPYSDKTPASVYIVDYTYTNIGYEDSIMDGLFLTINETIVDSNGIMGYRYLADLTYHPQQTPVGATCNAQACIGVDNSGPFKITVKKYDGNDNKQTATFYIEP